MSELHAWIPHSPGLRFLGTLPEEVIVTVWDGESEPSADLEQVRFYVPPWVPHGLSADVMARMPRLEVVQALTAGVDHVAALVPAGVTLCNARGANDPSASEWVLAAILASLRELPRMSADQVAGRTDRRPSDALDGKRVMILGHGSIGAAVERRLAGFDVDLTRVARRARDGVHPADELDALLPDTDVLIVLVPLDDSTRGLIDRARLALLPDGALVVNAARGGLIDQDALLDEVRAQRLRAALDVSEPDPLPADHPLRGEPGVLYTPHIGGMTRLTLPGVYGLVGRQLRHLAAGEPLENVV